MILTKPGRRCYYCHPHLPGEETRVKELIGDHGFEPGQALRPAHLASVNICIRLLRGAWAASYYGASQDQEPERSCIVFSNPALEATQCLICCILFTSHKSWPLSRGGEIHSPSWWRRVAVFLKSMWEWK